MHTKHKKLAEYLSLLAMTSLTVIAIVNKQISVFYILYLFWCDEFLKTIFDRLRYHFKRSHIENPLILLSHTKSRLFVLFVYLVFIIIFFGLMLDWNNSDLVLSNFKVFFFKNHLFNFSIVTFLLREVYLYLNTSTYVSHHLLSKGVITLHISIVLGMFLWFFIKKEFIFFENYVAIIAIVPFLLLKVFFEIQEIKGNHDKEKYI